MSYMLFHLIATLFLFSVDNNTAALQSESNLLLTGEATAVAIDSIESSDSIGACSNLDELTTDFVNRAGNDIEEICERMLEALTYVENGSVPERITSEARRELCFESLCVLSDALNMVIIEGYFGEFLQALPYKEGILAKTVLFDIYWKEAISRILNGENLEYESSTNIHEHLGLVRVRLKSILSVDSIKLFDEHFSNPFLVSEQAAMKITIKAFDESGIISDEQLVLSVSIISHYRADVWHRMSSGEEPFDWREEMRIANRTALKRLKALLPEEVFSFLEEIFLKLEKVY